MKSGVNQWSFPSSLVISNVLQLAAEAGFAGIELTVGSLGSTGLHMETTSAQARAIGKQARGLQLEVPSLATDLLWESPLSSPNSAVRERARGIVLKQLELAAALEVGTILVVPGNVTRDCGYAECYRRSGEELSALAVRAQELGVRIGIENVWNKFLLSPLEMAAFIDGCHSPAIGAYFDVGNILLYGYPEDWINTLGRRIISVHVKDFLVSVGNLQGFVPLFSGDVQWSSVRAALVASEYDGYLTAEVSRPNEGQGRFLAEMARSVNAIANGFL